MQLTSPYRVPLTPKRDRLRNWLELESNMRTPLKSLNCDS